MNTCNKNSYFNMIVQIYLIFIWNKLRGQTQGHTCFIMCIRDSRWGGWNWSCILIYPLHYIGAKVRESVTGEHY